SAGDAKTASASMCDGWRTEGHALHRHLCTPHAHDDVLACRAQLFVRSALLGCSEPRAALCCGSPTTKSACRHHRSSLLSRDLKCRSIARETSKRLRRSCGRATRVSREDYSRTRHSKDSQATTTCWPTG